MKRDRKALVGYDFQGWPIFKMTLKEVLLCLGGKEENGKIVFDVNDPALAVYPKLLEDDGMGYGVNEQCIVEADTFKSNDESDDKIYVNIFRADIPSEKEQVELFNRWDTEEREVMASIRALKDQAKF